MPRPATWRRPVTAADSDSIQSPRHLATPVADAGLRRRIVSLRADDARLARPLLCHRAVMAPSKAATPAVLTTPGAYCTCGHANAATAKFCTACGMPLAAVCLPCGQRNPLGARFCNHCGVALPVATGGPQST